MSPSEPFTSLLEAADIEAAGAPDRPLEPEAEKRLRALLSRPLAPLGDLDKTQQASLLAKKGKKKEAKLDKIVAALDRIQPDWIDEYAAAAVVQLPAKEQRLRGAMLRQLLKKDTATARALSLIAAQLGAAPGKDRPVLLASILKGIGSLTGLCTVDSPENIRSSVQELVDAGNIPATPTAFAKVALEIVRMLKLLYPSQEQEFKLSASRSLAHRLAPLFDEPYRSFLLRKSWGKALGGDIRAVLWDRLWSRLLPTGTTETALPVEVSGVHEIDCSAARIYQIETSLRMYFGGGGALTEKVRSVLNGEHPALAKEFAFMVAQQRLLLQAIRNFAALRSYRALGAADDIVEFNPRLHVLAEGNPAAVTKIRVLEPPIVRDATGGAEEILAQGEVEEIE